MEMKGRNAYFILCLSRAHGSGLGSVYLLRASHLPASPSPAQGGEHEGSSFGTWVFGVQPTRTGLAAVSALLGRTGGDRGGTPIPRQHLGVCPASGQNPSQNPALCASKLG